MLTGCTVDQSGRRWRFVKQRPVQSKLIGDQAREQEPFADPLTTARGELRSLLRVLKEPERALGARLDRIDEKSAHAVLDL